MKRILFFLLITFNVSCVGGGQDINCSLTSPPTDSGVNGIHGVYIFVYPHEIPKNYNGCQLVWDEEGREWIRLRFIDSNLLSLKAQESKLSNETMQCFYSENGDNPNNSKSCFKYDEIKNGFPSVSGSKMKVPKDKDPRI